MWVEGWIFRFSLWVDSEMFLFVVSVKGVWLSLNGLMLRKRWCMIGL